MRNLLSLSYAILCALFAATIGGYLWGAAQQVAWLKDLSLNVGTEIFGILLTVFLIDAVIRRNEERERNRVRQIAFQQLRIPLLHQLHMLHGMYKGCIPRQPEIVPASIRELFSDDYFVQLAFLDFSKPAPLSSTVPLQWFDYLKMEVEKFKAALGRTIEKYAVFLDADSIALLERLMDASFISLIAQAPAIRDVDRRENFRRSYNLLAGQGMAELIRKYTEAFCQLVETYNLAVPAELKLALDSGLWRNDMSPQFDSARLVVPRAAQA
ncbi:hypothetical protein [Noviherbaspirillum sp.]|uniref:hypothetical protein n=1 Tax=Noviherbaspirillum sp. TaxID=1926288 RepID=UPI002B493998|nr:hypothetical protein [Noviherbaspirillum sp.]HJV82038.1 hypothetical protein [Noviherbaspirillum sp.]